MFPSIIPHDALKGFVDTKEHISTPFYGREDTFHTEKYKDRVDAVKHMIGDRKRNRQRFTRQDMRRQVVARGRAVGSGNTMTFINTNMSPQYMKGGVIQDRAYARNLLERRAAEFRELENQHIDDPLSVGTMTQQQPIPMTASETKKLAITLNLDEIIALANKGVDSKENIKPDEIKKLYMSILDVGFDFSKEELLNLQSKVNDLYEDMRDRQNSSSKVDVARLEMYEKLVELVNTLITSYNLSERERAMKLKTLGRDMNLGKKSVRKRNTPASMGPPAPQTPTRVRRGRTRSQSEQPVSGRTRSASSSPLRALSPMERITIPP